MLKKDSISIASHSILSRVWDYSRNEGQNPSYIGIKSCKFYSWLCYSCSAPFVSTAEETYRHRGLCPDCHRVEVKKHRNEKNDNLYGSVADVPFIMDLWCEDNPDPHTIRKWSSSKAKIHCADCGSIVERVVSGIYEHHSFFCKDCEKKRRALKYQKRIIAKTGSCADFPEIMAVWDFDANEINPQNIPSGSRYKIYCKCPQCGIKWQSFVYQRKGKDPLCQRCATAKAVVRRDERKYTKKKDDWLSFADVSPINASWWHPTLNGNITPADVPHASGKDFFWICPNNHVFKSTPRNMKARRFCPVCRPTIHSSFIEMSIAFYLNEVSPVEQWVNIPGTRMSMDIYLPLLNTCIEYDGVVYHKNLRQYKRDLRKDELLEQKNIGLIRIKEWSSETHSENTLFFDYNKFDLQGLLDTLCEMLSLSCVKVDLLKDSSAIYQKLYPEVVKNSISKKAPHLVPYWDLQANNGVSPDKVNVFSTLPFSWKCPICNAKWEHSPIGMMRRKNICQVCNPYEHNKGKKIK
nr:MAG TPA: endonuclease [Caudoviricetes sp.]